MPSATSEPPVGADLTPVFLYKLSLPGDARLHIDPLNALNTQWLVFPLEPQPLFITLGFMNIW